MALKHNNILGVILAGGNNSRYNGTPKALLKINGKTLYQITKEKLQMIFEDVILITNTPEIFPNDECLKYADIYKNIGPLGGIHSALRNNKNYEAIFVTAVDMPFLNEEIIEKLISVFALNKPDILIPKFNNQIEPLNAVYKIDILGNLEFFIEKTDNYAIRKFFNKVNTQFLELENNEIINIAFTNINTPEEYYNLTKR